MEIGFVGLGKMGMNMVARLLQDKHDVVAYNRTFEKTEIAVSKGAKPSSSLVDLVQKLSVPRVIWLMIPAGDPTEEAIQQISDLLDPGDIVIDGGNAFYKDSIRRAEALKQKNINFLDAGVSGGIWGLKEGYCLMVGGEKAIFDYIEPALKTLALDEGYLHVGKSGAGHFVKMVHNGIEYALLQAYGEGFEILNTKKEFDLDLQKIAHLWNQGSVVRSWLLELTENVFQEDPKLESIKGYVEDSGEGRWTVKEAMALDVPAPAITLSLLERFRSRQKESFCAKVIAALRNQFGGHKVNKR